MSKDKKDIGVSMEEIDRRIDEMPVFDLRDPKVRKQTNINIDDILESLNLETLYESQQTNDVKNLDNVDDDKEEKDEDEGKK